MFNLIWFFHRSESILNGDTSPYNLANITKCRFWLTSTKWYNNVLHAIILKTMSLFQE